MPSIVIQNILPYTQYTLTFTGDNQPINVPFTFFAQTDLTVLYTASGTTPIDTQDLLTYNTNYTVSINADYSGGKVTLVQGSTFNGGNSTINLNVGDIVTITRTMPDERLNYYLNTAITANALNTDFESLVLMVQQNSLVNTSIAPHYNFSANPQNTRDIILPLLGPNQVWMMDPTHSFIEAVNFGSGGGGGGGGSQIVNTVTQTLHGFSVGQIVKFNGTQYVLAKADTASDAEVLGMVSQVQSANTFSLCMCGYLTQLNTLSLIAGTLYFLSDATSGALTATEPVTVGHISKPLFIADSSNSGYFFNFRGKVIPANIGWSVQTSDITMEPGGSYFANGSGRVIFTLPATFNIGDAFTVYAMNSNGFQVAQAAGQTCQVGITTTTTGTGGYINSANVGDMITLVCSATDTTLGATAIFGNLTVN